MKIKHNPSFIGGNNMEPKTFFILLAIGVAGLAWSFIRQTNWYHKLGENILYALDIKEKK
jgi:hypothetical protein